MSNENKKFRNNDSGLHIAELEVTDRCNLSCFHCYATGREHSDIDYDLAIQAISQLNDLGINRLVFTGGEPLLYGDLFSLAKFAKDIGIPEIALLTNGLLASENNIEELRLFDKIQISIDYVDSTQGGPRTSSFSEICDKVSFFKEHGIKVHLFATIHKLNIKYIGKLVGAAEELGVTLAFNTLVPINENQKHLCLSLDQHKYLLQSLHTLKTNGRPASCSDRFMFYFRGETNGNTLAGNKILGGCLAGVAVLYITKEGDVWPCPFVQISCGHVRNIAEIWENSELLNLLRNRKKFNGQCGSCEHVLRCGGCRAVSLMNSGTVNSSDSNCFIKVHS